MGSLAYKMLVLDIDGTLTNSRKQITQRTQRSLELLQQSGAQLVLASGRPTYGIMPLAEQLDMARHGGYILSFNGGQIVDLAQGRSIYKQLLPKQIVPTLYREATQAGCAIITYRDQYIITEQPDNKYVQHEVMLTRMEPLRVENFVEAVEFAPDKCLIVGEASQLIPLAERLTEQYGDVVSAYRSEPFFLEVVPKGIDKAESLKRLMAQCGVEASEMMAIGDGYNDITMIRLAGLGVAMANGAEAIKEAADCVTLSNDDDGVAAAIEQYMIHLADGQ